MNAPCPHAVQRIRIHIPSQTLTLLNGDGPPLRYAISTSSNGVGQVIDSGCTPAGRHIIRAKIGRGAPLGTVFVGRRLSGEVFTPSLRVSAPERDWVLTRILWLSGCEPGFNRLGQVDSMRRYIYIHGSPDDVAMGRPGSGGCIRMRNHDVAALFEQVACGTRVDIDA